MLENSARNRKPNRMPQYSFAKPVMSSDSASDMSNGVWLRLGLRRR